MKISIWSVALLAFTFGMASAEGQGKEQPAKSEQKAIQAIEAVGGTVREIAQNDDRLEVAYPRESKIPIEGQAPLTDEHLAILKDLPKIVHLRLGSTSVTDQGLSHLEGLPNLTRLNLERTKITDVGLKHLGNLKNLTYLNLYATEISDTGLLHLNNLSKLKKLYVSQTKVTKAGAADLQKALPKLDINTGLEQSGGGAGEKKGAIAESEK